MEKKKARLVEQIRRLWRAERVGGRLNPIDELLLDLDTMSEAKLFALNNKVANRLRAGMVRTPRHENPEPVPVGARERVAGENLFGEPIGSPKVSRPRSKRDRILDDYR